MTKKAWPVRLVKFMVLVMILTMSPAIPVQAAANASFWLGPYEQQIFVGDTMFITGNLITTNTVGAFDLTLTYDATRLQYMSTEIVTPMIEAGELDVVAGSGKVHLLYLDADGGLTGITTGYIFKILFRVVNGSPGDKLLCGMMQPFVADSEGKRIGSSFGGVQHVIGYPSMANTELASLTVDYGQLQPAFSPSFGGTYSLSVPYSIERIQVDARPVNERCIVTIINPPLVAGSKTTIEIKVEHPGGAFRYYGIFVTRARAPGQSAGAGGNGPINNGTGGIGQTGDPDGTPTGGIGSDNSPDSGNPAVASEGTNILALTGQMVAESTWSSENMPDSSSPAGLAIGTGSADRTASNVAAGAAARSDEVRTQSGAHVHPTIVALMIILVLAAIGAGASVIRHRRRM